MEPRDRTSPPRCSVIVLTYRSGDSLRACVASLRPQVDALGGELIVVDNASPDDSVEVARELGIEPVLATRNLGFAAGCNLGARHATGDVLVFVNPDAVVDDGGLRAMLDALDSAPDIGIAGGRAHAENGSYDPRCVLGTPSLRGSLSFALGLDSVFRHHRVLAPEQGPAQLPTDRPVITAPAVSGALLAVDREAWEQLGGFDEGFFLYGEDVDLCLRGASAGWRTVVATGAGYRHVGGASSTSGLRDVLLYRGKVELYRRQLSPPAARVAVAALQAGTMLRSLGVVAPLTPVAARASRWAALFRARRFWREGHLEGGRGVAA
jgi:N-acetylglucosaminyl-diphospho-decaprenol L-rhamnosyltransferase